MRTPFQIIEMILREKPMALLLTREERIELMMYRSKTGALYYQPGFEQPDTFMGLPIVEKNPDATTNTRIVS